MGNEIGEILKKKQARLTGAAIGFVIGILIMFPRIFILIICVLIGYFVGRYFEEKGAGEVLLDKDLERNKK